MNRGIWRRASNDVQQVIADLVVGATLILGLAAINWLLHLEILGFSEESVHWIEVFHLWLTIGSMVAIAARSFKHLYHGHD